MKTLLIVVAFGAAAASPAFARSGNGHHHQQRLNWSGLNVHQQWAPSNLNNFEDRNYEGYPRSSN
jgi:hypothetical protein